MKFAADEGVDARLVRHLRSAGHDVWYYAETERSSTDLFILKKAAEEERILITRDKDFGELAFKDQILHTGIILLRLEKLPSQIRVEQTIIFIEKNLDKIAGHFIVLRPGAARLRPLENKL